MLRIVLLFMGGVSYLVWGLGVGKAFQRCLVVEKIGSCWVRSRCKSFQSVLERSGFVGVGKLWPSRLIST